MYSIIYCIFLIQKDLSTDEVTTSVRRSRVTSPNNKKEDKNNHSNTAKEDNRFGDFINNKFI